MSLGVLILRSSFARNRSQFELSEEGSVCIIRIKRCHRIDKKDQEQTPRMEGLAGDPRLKLSYKWPLMLSLHGRRLPPSPESALNQNCSCPFTNS